MNALKLKENLKPKYNSKSDLKIDDFYNSSDIIKEIDFSRENISNLFHDLTKTNKTFFSEKQFKKKINKTKNNQTDTGKKSLQKLNSKTKANGYSIIKYFPSQTPRIRIIPRQLSNQIIPCKTISLNKKKGINSKISLNNINNINDYNSNRKLMRKCLSSPNNSKNKKIKLKTTEVYDKNLKDKSPLDILVNKIAIAYDIKLAHKKFSSQGVLDKFLKTNFKNVRDNFWLDKYFYIKSKLKINTKSSQNKQKNNDKALNFDEHKYKLFKNISKKLKKRIKLSAKNLDVKKKLEKFKKEYNFKNLAKIKEMKSLVEDENILLTPKNFLKRKKDPFISYQTNQLVQKLNPDLTYRNRFILAKTFGIPLGQFL